MRLSTAGMHRNSIEAILENQYKLAKTQEQITTGRKFQTAAEDPIGAVRSAALDRTLADNEQYGRNSNIIESRLGYEEQALADATALLQSVRDRALQGANSTLGPVERRMIANDVRQHLAALLDIANRDDSNGEYLFAGTRTSTRPFAQGSTGVNYQGDLTNRQIRISGSQALADGHTGADVFMNIAERNGVFHTSVNAANTGSGNGRETSSMISDAIVVQLPQPLPSPVRIVSSDTVRTPDSAARRMSWSVTPWQRQTYKAADPR